MTSPLTLNFASAQRAYTLARQIADFPRPARSVLARARLHDLECEFVAIALGCEIGVAAGSIPWCLTANAVPAVVDAVDPADRDGGAA